MKNLHKILIVLISFFFCFSCSSPSNNRGMPPQHIMHNNDNFFVDPLVFYDMDSSKARLDLYIKIPVESIIYKKNIEKKKYESVLFISVILKNSNNEQIFENKYNVSSSFNEEEMKKMSKEYQYYFYNYYLEHGKYKLEVKINDENSKSTHPIFSDVSVKDFKNQSLNFSDIMLLSHYSVNEDSTKEITPLINNNIFSLNKIFIFFEIYNNNSDTLTKDYVYKLRDNKNNVIKEESLSYTLSQNRNKKTECISLKNELQKYTEEEPDFEFFPAEKIPVENFKLEIIDKSNNEIMASKTLTFRPDNRHMNMKNKPPMRQ